MPLRRCGGGGEGGRGDNVCEWVAGVWGKGLAPPGTATERKAPPCRRPGVRIPTAASRSLNQSHTQAHTQPQRSRRRSGRRHSHAAARRLACGVPPAACRRRASRLLLLLLLDLKGEPPVRLLPRHPGKEQVERRGLLLCHHPRYCLLVATPPTHTTPTPTTSRSSSGATTALPPSHAQLPPEPGQEGSHSEALHLGSTRAATRADQVKHTVEQPAGVEKGGVRRAGQHLEPAAGGCCWEQLSVARACVGRAGGREGGHVGAWQRAGTHTRLGAPPRACWVAAADHARAGDAHRTPAARERLGR